MGGRAGYLVRRWGFADARPSRGPDTEAATTDTSHSALATTSGAHATTSLPSSDRLVAPRAGPIPSLDGLRAISVLIVVVSHAGYGEIVPGGLGVTVFFFLSGYLITTLLLDEHGRGAQINVKNFYLRRGYRLLPPLLVTLLCAYALVAVGWLDGGITWQGTAAQLFYFANFFTIFFAEDASQPAGTGILWSLAVEEHFYIIFPIVMYFALRLSNARAILIGVFAVLCVAGLAWRMWLVSKAGFIEIRTQYATDTRFDSILFGCLLALWKNPARMLPQAGSPSPSQRRRDLTLCAVALLILLGTLLYRDATFRESWRYTLQGIALMPIFYCAVRYATTGPFKVLNARPLVRIGALSYAIYLIHYIVIHSLSATLPVDLPRWGMFALTVAIAVGFASAIDRHLDPYFRRRRAALH